MGWWWSTYTMHRPAVIAIGTSVLLVPLLPGLTWYPTTRPDPGRIGMLLLLLTCGSWLNWGRSKMALVSMSLLPLLLGVSMPGFDAGGWTLAPMFSAPISMSKDARVPRTNAASEPHCDSSSSCLSFGEGPRFRNRNFLKWANDTRRTPFYLSLHHRCSRPSSSPMNLSKRVLFLTNVSNFGQVRQWLDLGGFPPLCCVLIHELWQKISYM